MKKTDVFLYYSASKQLNSCGDYNKVNEDLDVVSVKSLRNVSNRWRVVVLTSLDKRRCPFVLTANVIAT